VEGAGNQHAFSGCQSQHAITTACSVGDDDVGAQLRARVDQVPIDDSSDEEGGDDDRWIGTLPLEAGKGQLLLTDFWPRNSVVTSSTSTTSTSSSSSSSSLNDSQADADAVSLGTSQRPRGVPRKSDWPPTLLAQHDAYRQTSDEDRRRAIFSASWTKQERAYVFSASR